MNEEYQKALLKKWKDLEEKLKKTTDPQQIEEIKMIILQCKFALSRGSMSPKSEKSKSPIIT